MACAHLHSTVDEGAGADYRRILRLLSEQGIDFLVGGTYAVEYHTRLSRGTKDLDLFIVKEAWPAVVEALGRHGIRCELVFAHWLGKAFIDDRLVDFVFASGNGLGPVTRAWFELASWSEVCGEAVRICPAEEMIWSKAFLMERERFDGADVLHLIRARRETLDWSRLLQSFGPHWRVLFAHIVLFDFVYPAEREAIPDWIRSELLQRGAREMVKAQPTARVCQGTLLSRAQYLIDVTEWDYKDPRLEPEGTMTHQEVKEWTEAALREAQHSPWCEGECEGDLTLA